MTTSLRASEEGEGRQHLGRVEEGRGGEDAHRLLDCEQGRRKESKSQGELERTRKKKREREEDAQPSGEPLRSSIVNQYSRFCGLAWMSHLGERRSSSSLLTTLGRDGGGRGLCGREGRRPERESEPEPNRSRSSSNVSSNSSLSPSSFFLGREVEVGRRDEVEIGVLRSGTVTTADEATRGAGSSEPQTSQSGCIDSQKVPSTPASIGGDRQGQRDDPSREEGERDERGGKGSTHSTACRLSRRLARWASCRRRSRLGRARRRTIRGL